MSEYTINYEREIADMEACLIDTMDAYFEARPQIERKFGKQYSIEAIFEAAFKRGWNAKSNQLNKQF